MPHQQWEIEGHIFPSAPIALTHSHAQAHVPYQFAYLCPTCGRVWARRRVEPSTRWMAFHRACGKCPGELFIRPGSIDQSWDYEFLRSLPKEVLEYELAPLEAA